MLPQDYATGSPTFRVSISLAAQNRLDPIIIIRQGCPNASEAFERDRYRILVTPQHSPYVRSRIQPPWRVALTSSAVHQFWCAHFLSIGRTSDPGKHCMTSRTEALGLHVLPHVIWFLSRPVAQQTSKTVDSNAHVVQVKRPRCFCNCKEPPTLKK